MLDEPLASLDASRREEVLPYLEALRDQLAIPMVFVSHNFDEVLRLATHLVLMEAGKTVAQGNLRDELEPRSARSSERMPSGAIVDGTVLGADPSSALTRVQVGQGELKVQIAAGGAGHPAAGAIAGARYHCRRDAAASERAQQLARRGHQRRR